MAVRLTIFEDGDASSGYERTFLQDRIVIGRSRSSDICLPDMAVSTRHAEIRLNGTEYVLMDLESLNGSFVNDKPVQSFQKRSLRSGDLIQIAGFSLRLALGVGPGPDEPRDVSVRQAREMLARLSIRSGRVSELLCLAVTAGPCRGDRLTLHPGARAVLGRGSDSTLVLEDRDVSRAHVEIVAGDGFVTVQDLGSKNGIVYEGVRVESLKVSYGESFTIGKSTLLLEHPAESTLGAIFEAPEEETSSFAYVQRAPSMPLTRLDRNAVLGTGILEKIHPPAPGERGAATDDLETAEASAAQVSVGPADPLVGETEPPAVWHTAEQVRLEGPKPKEGSDVGLIIIGILLLLAATVGLAYLFH